MGPTRPSNGPYMSRSVCALLLASMLASPAGAQPLVHPPTVTPDGAAPVRRAAEATRADLLGLVELYRLALYVDGPTVDRARLLSPDVPKALRIVVIYEDSLKRRVAFDWRAELLPRLEQPATAHLRGTFGTLRQGNVLLVEYAPGRGTTVRADKAVVVERADHELMLAFLDHWLGQRPISEEIKRALLGSS